MSTSRHNPPAGRTEVVSVEELDRVRLTRRVTADCGRSFDAGSKGTVVSIYDGGAAFCIEFTSPAQALATVRRADIEVIVEETIARLASSSKSFLR